MGGRLAAVRQPGTRRSELFNFQRSVSHRRRHLTMRTVALGTASNSYSRDNERPGVFAETQTFQSRLHPTARKGAV
jgi:hypothetical protein